MVDLSDQKTTCKGGTRKDCVETEEEVNGSSIQR